MQYLSRFLLFFSFLIFYNCSTDSDNDELEEVEEIIVEEEVVTTIPEVKITNNNSENTNITYSRIVLSGSLISDGGEEITSLGICYSSEPSPTINDKSIYGDTESFEVIADSLLSNTQYYFRAFATNINGTAYSAEHIHSTLSLDETTWDFHLIHNEVSSWHADVTFNPDGTTVYDEPEFPGVYTMYGVWSVVNDTLYYDLNSEDDPETDDRVYQFTGYMQKDSITGTYTFGPDTKVFTAIKYNK